MRDIANIWKKVFRPDETKDEFFGLNAFCYVWQKTNTAHHSEHTMPTVKDVGGSTRSCSGLLLFDGDKEYGQG